MGASSTPPSGHPGLIVVRSNNGFSRSPFNRWLMTELLEAAWTPRPRVMLIPTAAGDSPDIVSKFYAAYKGSRAITSHLSLFDRTVDNLAEVLLKQEILVVPGGSAVNLLAIWRAHGVDEAVRKAWENGTMIVGSSAGGIALFEAGLTDSLGSSFQPTDGLGLLQGSFCPHAEDKERLHTFCGLVAQGRLHEGLALSENAAAFFRDGRLDHVSAVDGQPRAFEVSSEEGSTRLKPVVGQVPLALRLGMAAG